MILILLVVLILFAWVTPLAQTPVQPHYLYGGGALGLLLFVLFVLLVLKLIPGV